MRNMLRCIITIGIISVLAGCRTNEPVVYWKSDLPYQTQFNMVMVAAILPAGDSLLRQELEMTAVKMLREKGVSAVAASERFGIGGLAALSQENTFKMLCESGIDAVLSIAKIDSTAQHQLTPCAAYASPALYFFQRLWSYRELTTVAATATKEELHNWEGILFDLSSLRPVIVLNTALQKSIPGADALVITGDFIRKLFKARALTPGRLVREQKPF